MKSIKMFIPLVMTAMLLIVPQAALAAENTAAPEPTGFQKMPPDREPPPGDCGDGKCKKTHRGEEAAFRVYSLLTGKPVETLKKACADGKLTIWELAKKDGKLDALKEKLIAARAASLDALVKAGVMTQEERDRILVHIREELNEK
jgi:hypothetical protein